jgi:hypothetical protein
MQQTTALQLTVLIVIHKNGYKAEIANWQPHQYTTARTTKIVSPIIVIVLKLFVPSCLIWD